MKAMVMDWSTLTVILTLTGFTTTVPVQPRSGNIALDDVTFQLYTRDNLAGTRIFIGDEAILNLTSFNAQLPTKIIVHGWMDALDHGFIRETKQALLDLEPMNVIGVGWYECAHNVLYEQSVDCARQVGGYIGNLIVWLMEVRGVLPSQVHGIGHSLGGEAISFVSDVLKIGRITGLDAAKPMFSLAPPDQRLDPTDADFVDSIHTSTNIVGMSIPIGQVDFYPNGGAHQPGCNDIFGSCAHGRAYQYFIKTISNENRNLYVATECNTLEEAKNQTCSGNSAVMGYGASPEHKGIYYISIDTFP